MLDVYKQALASTQKLIEGVKPDQFSKSTPCPEFDVKALLNHLVGGNYLMATVAAGKPFDPGAAPADLIGNDPAGAYKTAAEASFTAYSGPDVMSKTLHFPFGDMPGAQGLGVAIMEAYVHGWDLARATGQDGTIPAPVAETILTAMKARSTDHLRPPKGNTFGPEVTVSDSASASDKLVAFLGRKP
jgi:uncharacterized protein (TIGR03086 family)